MMLKSCLFITLSTFVGQSLAAQCDTTENLRQLATTKWWSLPYLNLANYAYANATTKTVADSVNSIPRLVQAMPDLQCKDGGFVGGSWSVPWGPTYAGDNSNLMFAVEFKDSNGAPIFTSLVIRGTNGAAGPYAIFQQVFQDLDAPQRVEWSKISGKDFTKSSCTVGVDDNNPVIAKGTCNGMAILLNLKAQIKSKLPIDTSTYTARQFLQIYLKTHPTVPILVTGHSLGGTQTEAISLWLKSVLPAGTTVGAFPFAPASAGNPAFAKIWDQQLGQTSTLWANNLDVVPYGFQNVPFVKQLYGSIANGSPNYNCPDDVKLICTGLAWELRNKAYQQPSSNFTWLGSVVAPLNTPKWVNQVTTQHFPPMYYTIMCNEQVLNNQIQDYQFQGLGATPVYWKKCGSKGDLPSPESVVGKTPNAAEYCKPGGKYKSGCCCAPHVTKTVYKKGKATVAPRDLGIKEERQVSGQHLCKLCINQTPLERTKPCCHIVETTTVTKVIKARATNV